MDAAVPDPEGLGVVDASTLEVTPVTNAEATKVSKAMSLLLRHRGTSEGLRMTRAGWVRVDELLRNKRLRGVTPSVVAGVVRDCSKQRFAVGRDATGALWIRANQGHSVEVAIEHTPIVSRAQLPNGFAVHGTYHSAWKLIRQSGGLSRMTRQHIHMAVGLPEDDAVISGMRSSAQVLVYVDVDKCIAAKIPLFLSANGVVLSPGDDKGMIPLAMFERVVNAKSNKDMEF